MGLLDLNTWGSHPSGRDTVSAQDDLGRGEAQRRLEVVTFVLRLK